MTPAELSRTVLRSVRGAVAEQELSVPVPARIVVQQPPRPGCGDYASNVALQLAGPAGRPAREVAEILRKRLVDSAGIARVEIAGPGFLNFTLGDGAQVALVREVLAQGDGYGDRAAGRDPVARVLPVGHEPAAGADADASADAGAGAGVREAVVAEALARIEAAAGLPHGRGADDRRADHRTDGRPADHRTDNRPAHVPAPYDLGTLIARLGVDEARWVLLRPAAHDRVQVPERPVQRESNPRFRVQYACARSRALVRNADELGFAAEPGDVGESTVEAPAGESAADVLHAHLAAYPSVVEVAARRRAPDRVVRHLEATADAYFRWHDVQPPLPVGEQKPLAVHRARLALAEAAGTVLANGLRLLGISAPEHL
ncbi:ArgS-related anticodon-binding protein NrtL [Streptomyces sp. NPDC048506]|uniref:ArgS-related anticodon-binding protein NrtL n=1 Tax=Streptomyces sp. NPDC048506 TaxID=3155028 RepID=UPI003431341F